MGTRSTKMQTAAVLLWLASCVIAGSAQSLPSCEADMNAHCMDSEDYEDLMPAGIDRCLKALPTRSGECDAYLKLIEACADDLEQGSVCGTAMTDGDAMPCLILRNKPADLSAACAAALPVKEEATGLKKFWSDGKRFLEEHETAELNEEDLDDYQSWEKRKLKKTGKSRERDLAVKLAKAKRVQGLVTEAATAAALEIYPTFKSYAAGLDAVTQIVKAEFDKALREDRTQTLVALSKEEIKTIAKASLLAAKKARKKEEL